ncbi:MAG: protein kinase [bacterium]
MNIYEVPMIGETIAHYKILEKLGEGGMGIVYKAEDTRLERTVALKFLPARLTRDEGARRRFISEARAASALEHPVICNIHSIEETETGETFICMAHCEGLTLKERIKNGPLPVAEAVDIAIQIAQGLGTTHDQGIVHRDIKPANIIVANTGAVKIVDFGLAKLMGQQLTKPGATMGTTAYLCFEQAQGKAAGPHSDIWSLGVVLYEMVTGQLPFKGEHEQVVLYSILNEQPEPLATLRPEAPAELQQIVNRCLTKEASRRYEQMHELLADLSLLTNSSAPKTAATKPRAPLAIAILPFVNLSPQRKQEYFCDGMTDEVMDALAKVKGWRVLSRTSAFAFKGKKVDIREVGRKLSVSHILEGSVRKAGKRLRITVQLSTVRDGFQLWSEKYDRELGDVFSIQEDIAQTIVDKLKVELAKPRGTPLVKRYTKNLEAYHLYLKCRYHMNRRSEEGLRQGKKYCEQAIAKDPDYALAFAGLADCLILLGFQGFLSPQQAMPKARAAAKRAVDIDDSLAEAHTSLACVKAAYDWDWTGSEKEFRRALELKPNSATAHHWYAIWYLLPRAEFRKCLAELRKAQELDPLSLILNTGLGWRLYFTQHFDPAIAELKKTIEMDDGFVVAHDLLGQCYLQKGLVKQALAAVQKAVALSSSRPLSLGTLGHAYAIAGNKNDAIKVLHKLEKLSRQKYISAYDIALIYTGLNDQDLAFKWLEKAGEERTGWLCFLNIEPRFAGLRSDPRFDTLIRKVGLHN